jgi:hypothetical protein
MKRLTLFFLFTIWSHWVTASNITSVAPLTDQILLVHFDDGEVAYPNDLNVDRLDVAAAKLEDSYTLSSPDDPDYQSGVFPTVVYRKTKGTEFVKDVPWNTEKWAFDPTGKPWAAEHWLYLVLEAPLQPGASYTLQTGALAANGDEWTFTFEVKNLRSEAVHTNTIGYLPDAPKFGYVYHWMGDGEGSTFPVTQTIPFGSTIPMTRKNPSRVALCSPENWLPMPKLPVPETPHSGISWGRRSTIVTFLTLRPLANMYWWWKVSAVLFRLPLGRKP